MSQFPIGGYMQTQAMQLLARFRNCQATREELLAFEAQIQDALRGRDLLRDRAAQALASVARELYQAGMNKAMRPCEGKPAPAPAPTGPMPSLPPVEVPTVTGTAAIPRWALYAGAAAAGLALLLAFTGKRAA